MPIFARVAFALVSAAAIVAPATAQEVARIVASAPYKAAVAALDRDHDRLVEEIVAITEIPAPPFKEEARGKAYLAMLRKHGLSDVETDAVGNVMGMRKGVGGEPLVVIAAHLDTVFPEGTPIKVRREGTRLRAPGIGDDSRGLAVLLAYIRAMDAAKIATTGDILFVGTVGEEGPGDLRGVRHFFTKGKYKDRVSAFFSMDGTSPARVTTGAVGSKRYHAVFKGPGGHSYGAFGLVNPMTAMGRAIVDLYEVKVSTTPKVTYSASVTGGGTSVNSIPNEVFVDVDMRSEDAAALATLEKRFLGIVDAAAKAENAARSTKEGAIVAEPKLIGDRPAGRTPADAAIVRHTADAVRAMGYTPEFNASSTDSNVPISLGIPAVTIGSGGSGARSHSLDEYIDVAKPESVRGMSVGLAALLAVAGMK